MKNACRFIAFCGVLTLFSCEDQLWLEPEENAPSPSSDDSSSTRSPSQTSLDESAATENISASPSVGPNSRDQPGAWATHEQFSFIPREPDLSAHDDSNRRDSFCNISQSSDTIILAKVHIKGEYVEPCMSDTSPKNTKGYIRLEVERLKHLGGEPVPLRFSLRRLIGHQVVEEGKDYLLGLREYDEGFYSRSGVLEVILGDSDREPSRVVFSGKADALVANAEAHMSTQRHQFCHGDLDRELFRSLFFDLDGTACQ